MKKNVKKNCLLLLVLLTGALNGVFAQKSTKHNSSNSFEIKPASAEHQIDKIIQALKGDGVIIKNVTSNQQENTSQIASFYDAKETMGIKKGILLTTGTTHLLTLGNTTGSMTGNTVNSENEISIDTIEYEAPCRDLKKEMGIKDLKSKNPNDLNPGWKEKQDNTNLTESHLNSGTDPYEALNNSVISVMKDGKTCLVKSIVISGYEDANHKTYYKPIGDEDLRNELKDDYILYDACVVEMDIYPLGETISFRYLFGSEEYDEYVCSQYNDAFAFFISGPGIKGKKNLAVLKNGARISINSINDGNPSKEDCKKQNPSFYNRNEGEVPLQYDGFTRTLEVEQTVIPFRKYHLKFVIADASDGILDSGVFLENKSIISFDKRYVLEFKSDTNELTEASKKLLFVLHQKLNQAKKGGKNYLYEITGHTDSDGSEEYNRNLAGKRIRKVVDFLKTHGAESKEMITINKGESMPIASNLTYVGKQKNRRVEIKLIPEYEQEAVSHLTKNVANAPIQQKLYPVPASINLNVAVKQNEMNASGTGQIIITNQQGQQVKTVDYNGNPVKINVSQLPVGIYTSTLILNQQKTESRNFIIAR